MKEIINKINQIEQLLKEIKVDLKRANEKMESSKRNTIDTSLPSNDEMIAMNEELFKLLLEENLDEIERQVKSKTKVFLGKFCKANDIYIDMHKDSKESIFKEIVQWLNQRKQISKEI